jgi:plastocyanin
MRRTIGWAALALWLAGCSASGSDTTTTGTSGTGASTASSGGATSGGAASSSGGVAGSGSGTSTGGASGGSTGAGSSTGGGSTTGNVCGIVLDAGMFGICGNTFFPDNVEVNIGDTVTFINGDGITHRPTSTDVVGDFDKTHRRKADGGWTFDTGFIGTQPDAGNNIVTVWVPTDAGVQHGVVQPFYCQFHGVHMSGNPSPTITVK